VLQATDLHAYYGKSHILRGVTLRVERGEVVALLGRNGVGKSTTLKALVGLVPVREGRVRLADGVEWRDVTAMPAHNRAALGIGYVPEDRRIFPYLTVAENIRVGLDRAARGSAARAAALDRVWEIFPALRDKRDAPGRFLSGGQQQMLAIARALVTNPRVILLDEPSQGLGPLLVESLMDVVSRMGAEGISIILVEQNAAAALMVSARAYVMDKGTISFAGEAAELRRDSQVLQRLLGVA
jgi:branched-chain amino acid transport system ATP-binding protein